MGTSAKSIVCKDISKTFRLRTVGGSRLLRDHLSVMFGRAEHETFHALKKVSFHVARGEGLAVIGPNGAGKSTLLAVVTGIAQPDSGSVTVNGRVAALLELGSGFHPDLTGRENVFLNSALLGYTERQAKDQFEEIVDFAGVQEFINEPLRTYSNGMILRLAFSVAIHLDPDILITDEVLAVGDQEFQAKCFARIHELRRAGKTFVCVSHNPAVLATLCDRAIWLDHGEMIMCDDLESVLKAYEGRTASGVAG